MVNIITNYLTNLILEMIKQFEGNRHKYISSNAKFIYHIAVIDYLQDFNNSKRMESMFKVYLLNRD
jgi:hypothetical protein